MPGTTPPHPRRFPWPWFWTGFVLLLLAFLLLVLFAGIRGTAQWAALQLEETGDQPPTVWSEVIQLTLLGGETLHLDPTALPALRERSHGWLVQREAEARQRLEQELNEAHGVLLEHALAQVPRFADWYYSLPGEYARLLHAALGDLPGFVAERMVEHVFEPAATTTALDELFSHLDQGLERELRMAASDTNALLARLLRDQAIAAETTMELRVVESRRLGDELSARLEPRLGLSPEDLARQGVATSAGALAGAVTMKKLGLATAGKLGLKAASGALAGAGGGAATGAALCGASVVAAPLVAGCALVGGVVTGIGTWVLVDKTVLEAEAYLRRATFETELRQALTAEFEALRLAMLAQYGQALAGGFTQLREGVDVLLAPTGAEPEETFVPARGAGGRRD